MPLRQLFVLRIAALLSCLAAKARSLDRTLALMLLPPPRPRRPRRYCLGDRVERWLNELLCLDAAEHTPAPPTRLPHPGGWVGVLSALMSCSLPSLLPFPVLLPACHRIHTIPAAAAAAAPAPAAADECELYYVERDTLFSYHKVSRLSVGC